MSSILNAGCWIMKESRDSAKLKNVSEEIESCISTLEGLVKDTGQLATLPEEQRIALMKVAGEISRPDRAEAKKRNKAAQKNTESGNF